MVKFTVDPTMHAAMTSQTGMADTEHSRSLARRRQLALGVRMHARRLGRRLHKKCTRAIKYSWRSISRIMQRGARKAIRLAPTLSVSSVSPWLSSLAFSPTHLVKENKRLTLAVKKHTKQLRELNSRVQDLEKRKSNEVSSAPPCVQSSSLSTATEGLDTAGHTTSKKLPEELRRFELMLKNGVPKGAVKISMRSQGHDPALLFSDKPTVTSKITEQQSVAQSRTETDVSPVLKRFKQMLQAGVPGEAVAIAMRTQGHDPSVLIDGLHAPSAATQNTMNDRVSTSQTNPAAAAAAAARARKTKTAQHMVSPPAARKTMTGKANAASTARGSFLDELTTAANRRLDASTTNTNSSARRLSGGARTAPPPSVTKPRKRGGASCRPSLHDVTNTNGMCNAEGSGEELGRGITVNLLRNVQLRKTMTNATGEAAKRKKKEDLLRTPSAARTNAEFLELALKRKFAALRASCASPMTPGTPMIFG